MSSTSRILAVLLTSTSLLGSVIYILLINFCFNFSSSTKDYKAASAKKEKNCLDWVIPETLTTNNLPQVKLDSRKILYPAIMFGPNNQLKGFKETIYLAIRTNRTLVIPPFYSHYTHKNKKMAPFEFIDVERLCSFISCISVTDMKKMCNSTFDVAFQFQPSTMKLITVFEEHSGMTILRHREDHHKLQKFPFAPIIDLSQNLSTISDVDENYWKSFKKKMSSNFSLLKTTYENILPCAVFTSAFNSIPAMSKKIFPISVTDTKNYNSTLTNASDEILVYALTQAIRSPRVLIEAASHYIRDVLQNKEFFGIHWRYDWQDWGKHCRRKVVKSYFKTACETMLRIKPVDVANGILKKFKEEVLHSFNESSPIAVYMATPPNLKDFRKQFMIELSKIEPNIFIPNITIEAFLYLNYFSCWNETGWKDEGEIESLVEMELMAKSSWFFYSTGTTWSDNIRLVRQQKENDNYNIKWEWSVYPLALNEMKYRTGESE